MQLGVGRLCLVAFLIAAAVRPAAAQSQCSAEATEVAVQIGVAPLMKRLENLIDPAMSMESLVLRQEITEVVLSASLDVDSVDAVIDAEIEQIRSIRADLQSRRDKAQNIINIASIVTGGAFGAVTSALQFKPSTVDLGNGIGIAGGTGSVALSIVGIRKQSGGRRSLGDSPRMLATFFGRQPVATEAIPSVYPEEVWSYLNSATRSNGRTRREQLLGKWHSEGRIEQDGSPKSERRIESITGDISQASKLDINDLNDRVAMLLDVRTTVSLMKRCLNEILHGLKRG